MSQIAESYGYTDVPDTFTRRLLLRVLKMHSADVSLFDADHAQSDCYDADAVLAWLGY